VLAATWEVLCRAASVLLACDIPPSAELGTIHFLKEAFEGSDREVNEALAASVDVLRNLFPGKTRTSSLRDITGDQTAHDLSHWYDTYSRIQWAEIWSCLGSWVQETSPLFGPRTAVSFDLVKNIDRKKSVKAIRERERLYNLLKNFLGANDLICMPTSPALAPIKETLGIDRSTAGYYLRSLAMTSIAGIGRLPQVSLPLGMSGGVPIGLSLIASQGMDAFLLAVAQSVDSHTHAHSKE